MASPSMQTNKNSNMLLEADQLIYDSDKKTVNLLGKVKIYYDGRTLEAHKVVYNQTTKRMQAMGNVRMIDNAGNVVKGDSFDIDDKFKEGFMNSLNFETTDRTFIGSESAVRSENGTITTFNKTTYTACEACEKNPKRAPLWQIKASKVVHKETEKTIYFHNARLEFLGVPLIYVPYFWIPDHTEKRKSGLLSPNVFINNKLGYGVETPYYHVFSPNHDATFSPTYYAKQGFLLRGEWRYGNDNLKNTIQGAIINQRDPSLFAQNSGAFPFIETPGTKVTRYNINIAGQYKLSPQWTINWDITQFSDRLFTRDYNVTGFSANNTLGVTPTEANSTIGIVGLGDRSYFDAKFVRYQGLAQGDRQNEIPDTFQIDHTKTFGKVFGGELNLKTNMSVVNRDQSDFDARTSRTLWDATNLRNYDGCDSMTPASLTPTSNNRFDCLLKGVGGNYTRLSFEANWRKRIFDNLGQIWEPFVSVRADLASLALRPNADVVNYFGPGLKPNTAITEILPTIGLTYRFPFVAQAGNLHSTLEPIAQIIVRPNESTVGRMPNEDAQSLVFDDTNLFSANKFSGWDRNEGGGRLNYGLNYTGVYNKNFYFNAMFGQSTQFFGLNSYILGDPSNSTGRIDASGAGANSGLDKRNSDYVGRFQLRPNENLTFSTRYRLDKDTYKLMRSETDISFLYKRLSFVGTYAYYGERPLLGYNSVRQGVGAALAYKLDENWTAFTSGRYDLDMNRFDGVTAGFNYLDECFQGGFFYSRVFYYGVAGGVKPPDDHRFMLRFNVRTLGETTTSKTILK
jgi:LPS-assembly protein